MNIKKLNINYELKLKSKKNSCNLNIVGIEMISKTNT